MEGKRITSFTVELTWNEMRLIAQALQCHSEQTYVPAAGELMTEFYDLLESDSE